MNQELEDFCSYLGNQIQAANKALSKSWLTRLKEVLSVASEDIFPSQHLLDHIPRLFAEIGKDLTNFDSDTHFTHSLIIEKSRELGEQRFVQQASVHQLLREYAILMNILEEFVIEEIRKLEISPPSETVLRAMHRINHDVYTIMQTTVDTFVERYTSKITDQQARLQSFNKLLGHELRKPVQAILSYAELLSLDEQTDATVRSRAFIIENETKRLNATLKTLEQISVVEELAPESLMLQEVDVEAIVKDVFGQTQKEARSRGVDLRVKSPLPHLKVETGKLDLVLRNLIDNGIKYSDSRKKERFVEVYQPAEHDDNEYLTLCVRDNGIGIPPDELNDIFTRFRRGHAGADRTLNITGYGIGLSVVKEALDRLGGSVEVESQVDQGTTFSIRLPKAGETKNIVLSVFKSD